MTRLSARYLATHPAFLAVTVFSIAIAVASIMATEILYRSARRSYASTASELTGDAVLQVTNGDVGVPEELVDEVRAVPGVRRVSPSVRGFVPLVDWPGERLYVLGIDLLDDRQTRGYGSRSNAVVDDPLEFLAAPDSVALTRQLLTTHGLTAGSSVSVLTPRGVARLVARAELGPTTGLASVLDGRLAVMDASAAQGLMGLDRRYSQLDVEIAPGVGLDGVENAVATAVAGRGAVERPRGHGRAVSSLLTSYRYGLLLASAVSVLSAIYLVFNAMTAALAARRRELGLLRALGMRRRGMVRMVAIEVLGIGALGCAAGIPLGYALARSLSTVFSGQLARLSDDVGVSAVALHGAAVPWAVFIGLATAMLAASAPLRELRALHAVDVLRPPLMRPVAPRRHARLAACGAALLVIAVCVWVARERLAVDVSAAGVVVMLASLLGVGLIVPSAVRVLVLRAEPIVASTFGVTGLIGTRAVVSEIRGVAVTCSALIMSLAGIIAVATWIASLGGTLSAAWDTVFGDTDVVVSAGAMPFSAEAGQMAGSVVDDMASLPGLHYVDGVRLSKIAYGGSQAMLIASDATLYVDGRRRLYMVDGREDVAAESLAAGRAVLVNQTFARRFNARPGGAVTLAAPAGEVTLSIAGIYLELAPGDLGTIRIDRALYRRVWGDDNVDVVEISAVRDTEVPSLVRTIRDGWGSRHGLVVLTMRQLRGEYDAMLGRLGALAYPLTMTAIAIALIGIVTTRVSSLLDRVRSIGTLRAVGATRGQIARMLAVESMLLGSVSGLLAVVVGAALGWAQVAILLRAMFGMVVLYRFPIAIAGFALAAVVLTTLASVLPTRSAARVVIADALRCE